MVATNVGIIYGATSGIVRRIVVPDNDQQLLEDHVGAGEAVLPVERLTFLRRPSVNRARQLVASHLGVVAVPTGRCAVVAGGIVVTCIMADPALDSVPEGELIQSDVANIGDTYDPATGEFTPPEVTP